MSDGGAECIFCKIVAGEIPSIKVYEDERVIAFMDINPLGEGHLLIIPRKHADTVLDIDPEDLKAVALAAQKVAQGIKWGLGSPGLNLIQSNGRLAGQVVNHFHLHLIPRWPDDVMAKAMNWELTPGDPEQIEETAKKIKAVL